MTVLEAPWSTPSRECYAWTVTRLITDELTAAQADSMAAVRHVAPEWFRARRRAEPMVLVSLWRRGLLERRAWSAPETDPNALFEYRVATTPSAS